MASKAGVVASAARSATINLAETLNDGCGRRRRHQLTWRRLPSHLPLLTIAAAAFFASTFAATLSNAQYSIVVFDTVLLLDIVMSRDWVALRET